MPHIYYQPDDRSVETQPEETILQTSLRERILHAHACGGHARCFTCRVVLLEGLEHCSPAAPKNRHSLSDCILDQQFGWLVRQQSPAM